MRNMLLWEFMVFGNLMFGILWLIFSRLVYNAQIFSVTIYKMYDA